MKQMRLITNTSFTRTELESYRQLVFTNLVNGMKAIVESLPEIDLYIEDDEEAFTIYQVRVEPIADGVAAVASDLNANHPWIVAYRTRSRCERRTTISYGILFSFQRSLDTSSYPRGNEALQTVCDSGQVSVPSPANLHSDLTHDYII